MKNVPLILDEDGNALAWIQSQDGSLLDKKGCMTMLFEYEEGGAEKVFYYSAEPTEMSIFALQLLRHCQGTELQGDCPEEQALLDLVR